MLRKRVLVVCYSFPPYPGIGGRRWAKFAKYLAREGNEIFVVSKQPGSMMTPSEWTPDVEHKNIRLFPTDVFYPGVFDIYPTSLLGKIMYRFWVFAFRVISNGMLYDRSIFWRSTILKEVDAIVSANGIRSIVVTGPPFRYMYFVSLLKKRRPNLKVLLDFRDPWTDNSTFMGIDQLSRKRFENELKYERSAIEAADLIITANEYYANLLLGKYPSSASKVRFLPNGIDLEEYSGITIEQRTDKEIHFVLAGSLYNSTEYMVLPLIDFLKNLRQANQKIYKAIKFFFYGNIDRGIEAMLKASELECFIIRGFVSKQKAIQAVANADYCMMITPPNHADNFNTKFFEYIALRKPIIHFSNEGAISEYLVQNRLGFPIRPGTFIEDMHNLIYNGVGEYNSQFDVSKFDIKNLAKELEDFL